MNFEKLVDLQRQLQVESFGVDPLVLEGEERVEYIRWNVLALTDELHEYLQEVGWKPWATSRHVNEDAAFGELVDAFHFLLNLILATATRPGEGVRTAWFVGEDFMGRYVGKRETNALRQARGYDGVTGKCPGCHRDLAEGGTITRTIGRRAWEICSRCDGAVRAVACPRCGNSAGRREGRVWTCAACGHEWED